jgi:hypothetical protein
VSERQPDNLRKENPYRRAYRRAHDKYQQYAERCRAAKHAIGNYCRAKYKQYGGWQYVERLISLLTVAGIWVYTAITAFILVINGRQLAELRAEFELNQRPWISVYQNAEITRPLTYDMYGAIIYLRFHLKNTGHSPAAYAMIDGLFFTRDQSTTDMAKPRTKCMETRRRPIDQTAAGVTIFPGEDFPQNVWFRMVPTDVIRLRQNQDVVPMIAGCVDYLYQFAKGHHQTAFAYELDKAGPSGSILRLDPHEGDMAPNTMLLEINPGLAGNAD